MKSIKLFLLVSFVFSSWILNAHSATAPPTLSPFSSAYSGYYGKNTLFQTSAFDFENTGTTSISFFNDYGSGGTLVIHIPEASSNCTVQVQAIGTGEIIPNHPGDATSPKSPTDKGQYRICYLKEAQKVEIRINDSAMIQEVQSQSLAYPVYIDYLPDSHTNMSEMDYLESAINRQYKGKYEATISGFLSQLDSVGESTANMLLGIQAADALCSIGNAAITPYSGTDPSKFGTYVKNTNQVLSQTDILSAMNTAQKGMVAASRTESPDIILDSTVHDAAFALGQLMAGDPRAAYQSIVVNFASASVFALGVYRTNLVERGINAAFLVKYLLAEHILQNKTTKFSDAYVTQMAEEWAEYTENQCGWFEDKAGCGLDNYNSDTLLGVYDNIWIDLQNHINWAKGTVNFYADVDSDGITNGVDTQPNTWNDTPPLPLGDFNLAITVTGTGSGQVTSTPSGLSCTTSCNADFEEDSIVWLIAQTASGSSFAGWSGACAGAGVTCAVTMSTEKSVSAEFTVIEDDNDCCTPLAEKVYPEDITNYVRQGERVTIRVRGSDNSDGHLSHVIYSASDTNWLPPDQAVASQSNNVDINDSDLRDDFNNQYEYTESVSIDFTGYNNGDPVYVYATVYDSVGKRQNTYWKFYIEPVYDPILSSPTPSSSEILNIPLIQYEFRVSMADTDDNAGDIEWWLNGMLIETTSTNGGGNLDEYHEDIDFHLYDQGIYTLEARITDEDEGNDSISWTVHAGFSGSNNAPVIIEDIHLDTFYGEELPHTLFRVGKVYQFQAMAADVDIDLKRKTCLLNGVIIDEYTDRDGDYDDMRMECMVSFKDAGENTLTIEFADAYDATVSDSIIVNVLPEDETTGESPSIVEAHPSEGTLWLQTDKDLAVELVLADPDGDQEGVIISLDNVEIERIEFESCAQEVTLDSTLFPSQRSYNVKFTPYDSAGHLGQTRSYSVNARQLGNHLPQIAIMDLWGDGAVRAQVNSAGERRAYFYYHAWDVDGDLAEVEILYNGVDPDDDRDYDTYTSSFDYGFNGRYDFRANNALAGTVTIRAKDSRGNIRSLSVPVRLEAAGNGHAPQFVNHNLPENGTVIIIPSYSAAEFGRRNNLFYMYDFFDQDGDLKEYRVSVNHGPPSVQTLASIGEQPNYFDEGHSLWTDGPGDEEYDVDLDNLVRGIPQIITLELEDFEGNINTCEWTIIRGPWGTTNHSPTVEDTVAFVMEQKESHLFSVTTMDEEGDTLTAVISGLYFGDELTHLEDGSFEYTPAESKFGNVSFMINWNDGFGGSALTEVNLFINQIQQLPGDINGDKVVNLKDGITALKIISGTQSIENIVKENNIGNNQAIGLDDSIYILRQISGLQ